MLLNKAKGLKNRVKWLFATPAERRHAMVGPMAGWEMRRDFQIKFLKESGFKPMDHLLDIGCGTLRGGMPIIEFLEEKHYYGIEAREKAVAEGKKELRQANLEHKQPVIIVSDDMASLDIDAKFEFIWAFSVLMHMGDDTANDCLGFVASHLQPDGDFYANVNIGEKVDQKWQGFPLVWRPHEFYADAARRNHLSVTDLGPIKSLG